MMADAHVGVWGQAPRPDPADQAASDAIDAQLRRDQLKAVRDDCPVLLLSGTSPAADAARAAVFRGLGAALGVPAPPAGLDAPSDAEGDSEAVVRGRTAAGTRVTAATFASSKRSKLARVRLAAADPALLLYVVHLPSSGADADVAAALRQTLGHLLFACSSIGALAHSSVCLLLANASAAAAHADALPQPGFEALRAALADAFASLDASVTAGGAAGAQRSQSATLLDAVAQELEEAARSFSPLEVRSMSVTGDAADGAALAQLLGAVDAVQRARERRVREADLRGGVHNAHGVDAGGDSGEATAAPTRGAAARTLLLLAGAGAGAALLASFALRHSDGGAPSSPS